MRMAYFQMPLAAGENALGGYELSAIATGGTNGIIGEDVSAICPASFLVTGGGTLLVATGYGPMLRMRQNEKHLSTAGVPRPQLAPIIENLEASAVSYQPTFYTMHFDFTRYGKVNGVANTSTGVGMRPVDGGVRGAGGGFRTQSNNTGLFITQGFMARQTEWMKYNSVLVPDIHNPAVYISGTGVASDAPQGYTDPGYEAMAKQMAYQKFFGVVRTGTGLNTKQEWQYMVFDLMANNQAAAYKEKYPGSAVVVTRITGRYQAYMRYVDKDENYSDPSPVSTDVLLTNAQYLQYSNLETPTDPRVVRRQIWRNANGSSAVFYLDIDTEDLTSTSLISRNTDAQLKLSNEQPVFDDNNYNLVQLYGEPPSDKPYIIEYNGQVFAAGTKVYREGNIIVTNGSDQITGIGTNWPATFQGRLIVIGSLIYTITSVTNGVITIDQPYAGLDNQYADYQIMPFYGNSNLMQWSEPGLPEAWPNQNNLSLPDDDDEVTGLVFFANSMWILKNHSIYQFNSTIDPNRDGDYKPVSNRGCVNQRCAVEIQSVALMLDRSGIHVFRGMLPRSEYQVNSTPDHLSKPIGDLFRFEGSGLRINWDADKCFWHAAHNKELTTVRWYVAMQGYYLPQHAICYDYLMDRWWVEEYTMPVSASCQTTVLTGKPILGGFGGKFYQPDLGTLDFILPYNTRHAVTACYGGVTLLLATTPPNCIGMPIAIVTGRGHGQQSIVLGQTGNYLYVDEPFTIFPDDTSEIQIGGIKYYAQTAEFNYAKLDQMNPQAVSYLFRNSTYPLEAYISVIKDGVDMVSNMVKGEWGSVITDPNDPTMFKVDMTDKSGCATVNMDGWRERDIPNRYSMQVMIEGFSGYEKPNINNVYIIGASQKQDLAV